VRYERCWAVSGEDEYRTMRSDSKLVMTLKKQAFELALKHHQLNNGPEV
jgi:hypothetical protein